MNGFVDSAGFRVYEEGHIRRPGDGRLVSFPFPVADRVGMSSVNYEGLVTKVIEGNKERLDIKDYKIIAKGTPGNQEVNCSLLIWYESNPSEMREIDLYDAIIKFVGKLQGGTPGGIFATQDLLEADILEYCRKS